MLNRGRIALVLATVVAVALAAWFVLVQVQARQGSHGQIAQIAFTQSQAVEDFDAAEYTQTDPGAIAQFQSLLDEFGIVPGQTDITVDACPGALQTELQISYEGGATVPMSLTTCGASAHQDFNEEATALVTAWREALAG